MRTIALLAATTFLSAGTLGSAQETTSAEQISPSQTLVSTQDTYVCPKCGKLHTRTAGSVAPSQSTFYPSPSVQPVSYNAPVASTSRIQAVRGGVQNVLSSLNAQRARKGIGGLRYDPSLQAVAEQRARKMASMGLKSHPPGSFSPGRYEGVGWSSSYSPSGVSACFTSDTRMQYAGAAMATGRDGVYFAVVYR